MERTYCYLRLTCQPGNEQEIANALLERRLIACAKFSPVHSVYHWKGTVEEDNESYITLESAEDLFDEIKAVVADTIKGYETFVLTAVPIARLNDEAKQWLKESLKEQS